MTKQIAKRIVLKQKKKPHGISTGLYFFESSFRALMKKEQGVELFISKGQTKHSTKKLTLAPMPGLSEVCDTRNLAEGFCVPHTSDDE